MQSSGDPMPLTAFILAIAEGGAVTVPPPAPEQPDDPRQLTSAIQQIDAAARLDIAGAAPDLAPGVTAWAARMLYRACQFQVYRDVDADDVRRGLAMPCPAKPSPSVCYSADLALRHLPDVWSLARGIAREDPLVEALVAIARAWPLSSVGIPDLGKVDVSAFIHHPALRRLYADRIIARGDSSRLDHSAVIDAVKEATGAFPEIAPALAKHLEPQPA
jgi:hypothetical protein